MAQLTPPFPEHQWPQVEVVIAHYQEPCEELAATLRAALDLDYPPERLIVSIIDDGYFKRHEAELPHHETVEEGGKDGVNGPRFEATAGGKAVVEMMRATYARFGDRFNTNRSGGGGTTISEVVRDLAPARHAVPGCDQRAGSLVLEFRKPGVPLLRLVARRKAKDSYFKGGNLNNALYNVFDPHSSFMVILDADMVPAEDFLQLSLPLFFEYDADAPPLQDNNADGDDFNHNQSPPPPHRSFPKKKKEEHGHGRWVCPWSVAMVASPQHYRNLDSNGSEDDPLNQRNESYTRRLQQRMDSLGLVHFCGTNTTFFIPALRDTLGFVTGLLSEDTPTGFDLARLGWDCFFVDQALATGTVKESASETMLQRFRWMGGNGLMYLFHKRFGSQGFLTHGPAQARAQRIQSLQNNTTEMQQQHGQQQEQRQHHGDSTQMSPFSMNSLVNTTNTSSNADPAFSSSLVLSLPADNDIAATYASSHAHSYPASAPSFSRNSRRLSASPSSSPLLSPVIMAPSSSLPAINAGEDPAPASPPSSSFTSPVSSSLLAVGTHDAGLAFRRQSSRHWLRRVVLWSVYDVGMGYMFTSTFWHAAFHAVMFDSLVFSDGERLVTMQPLFGVLYSLGSFGVLLSLGPTEQVLRVLNEWFAWAWLKAIAAGHVLDFSRSQKPDPPLDDGYFFFGAAHDETGDVHGIAQDSVERSTDDMTGDEHSLGGGQGETAAKDGGAHTKMALGPYRTKSRTALSLVVETKSSSSSGSSSSSSQVRRQSEGINGESSPITPLIRSRRGGCNGKSGDAVGRVGESEKGKGDFVMEPLSPSLTSTLSAAANAVANHVSYSGSSSSSSKRTHAPAPNSPKTPASPSSSSASGAAASSSGSWNAGVGFRLWLLVPPMLYYCLVLTMLVWTLFFGAAGQSMLHDTLLRTSSEVGEDGTIDPFSVLAPSVTTPQHVVGAFLAFIFLIHSWPIFKVSLLEVAGFKMFQGECHSGVVFALTLLIAPLVLVALASVPSDIIETVAEIGSDDGASFYDVVDAPSDMFQSQENTFQTFADAAAAAAAAAAAVAAVNHAGSGILYPWEQVLQPAMTVAWTAPLLANTASQPLSHLGGGGGLGRKRNGGNNNNRVNLMFGDRKYPVVASVGRHGQIYNSSSSSFTTTSSSVSSSKSKALADSGPLVSIYPGVALSFTADVSSVACGCTAALYLVSMPLHDVQDGTCPEVTGNIQLRLFGVSTLPPVIIIAKSFQTQLSVKYGTA
jgi:cellulose synthase/poly-beta-1,6-N-acetylglucosamine synthase-like glycosyltransferase